MLEEVTEAAKWWKLRLPSSIAAHMAEKFQQQLIKLLTQKYDGHWHPKDRGRGSGFRTLSYDHRIDPILLQASEAAGIKNIERLLESSRFIMFVNPGEVKVKNVSNADTFWDADVETIWRKAKEADEKSDKTESNSPVQGSNGTTSNGSGSQSEGTTSPTLSPEPSPPGSPKHTSIIVNGPKNLNQNGSNNKQPDSPTTLKRNLSSKLQPGAQPFVPSPNQTSVNGNANQNGQNQSGSSQNSVTSPNGSAQSTVGQNGAPVTILPRPANRGAQGNQGNNAGQINVQLSRNNS
jgi:hypothetical protein